MSQADRIREFVNEHYIRPTHERGDRQFTVRCGDVASALNLANRMPAVSAALGANKFEDEYNVHRVSAEGPLNGANCILTFKVKSPAPRA